MAGKQLTIAVVGASGVLGQALLPMLRVRGHAVRAISRNPGATVSGVEPVALDILAEDAERRLIAALRGCDAAVHIATAIPRDVMVPGAWDRNTRIRTQGTRRLLAACAAARVERYVQQSVVMAYPDGGDDWISEDAPLDRTPSRAQICGPVIDMEDQVRAIPDATMSWSIVRGGMFVGPGTMQDRLVADVARGSAHIVGTGAHFLSLVHVEDMARAVQLATEQGHHRGVFNICAEPLRQRDYVEEVARRLAAPPPARRPDLPPPPSWRCSTAAARDHLGWAPVCSIWPSPAPDRTRS